MFRRLLIGAAAVAALSACSSMNNRAIGPEADAARMDAAAAMPGDMTPTAAQPYMMMAGASDLFEIQSSQIALQKSQNPEVRRFAQMLVDHHTQTTATLMQQAQAAGMTPPPPELMPRQRAMIAQLNAADAASFDRVYLTQQVPAHQEALALHGNYAQRGDTPQLRTAAQGAVPIVQQHLTEAQRMQAAMGGM